MASTDIQIVSITNLEKIQTFLNDSAYKEILENSENYNTRLCIERRLRMPFLDPQTGVAQNHCALFMKQKQRMPGFRDGQIYTYPSSRWRKPKRQYLLQHHNYRAFSFRENQDVPVVSSVEGSSVSGTADNDSKDSHRNDEKDWFYEDLDINHVEDFEEDPESDFDFDESYSSRRRKRKNVGAPRKSTVNSDPTPVKRGRGRGKGRKKADGESRRGGGAAGRSSGPPSLPPNTSASASPLNNAEEPQMPILTPEQKLPGDEADPERRKAAAAAAAAATATAGSAIAASSTGSAGGATPTGVTKPRTERGKAPPSPYCDFCLGDARENKKTSLPEELVSCSDCGRSGHPSCLQFTPNMIISVKRYRWQCIECKYCSICGTSDNDDQLLFCDDCDRGYHMYCLSPPLTVPPEGSWSCKLCLEEFHSGKKKD